MKKAVWGPIIWDLLHCLTIKIKDDKFVYCKDELIKNIMSILSNLPCPECSKHASSLFKKYNIKNINDKKILIKALFVIHEDVNKRLRKPLNEYTILDKYNNYNLKEVVTKYVNALNVSNYSEKMLLYSFGKKKFLISFIKYIKNNINNYD
tara:strand:+ start:6427 stop:6879 length:453 start_codon:yes stop_codon:yes gene_type:complete